MEEVKISTSKSQKELDSLIEKLKEVGKQANLSEKEIDEMLSPLEKQKLPNATKQTEKLGSGMGKLGGIAKGVGSAFIAAFAVENLVRFVNEVMNIEREFTNLSKQVSRFSGLTGTALDKTTSKVAALSKTFGKDLNDVLIATNSLAKQSEISFDEAFTLIEKGFLQGADVSGDFLDKVKEYPIQFKNSGRSAEDFIKIATQEVRGGVFSDKLLDSIKELGLSIREMDKAQQDALQNAFGSEFTQAFVRNVNEGKISVNDAFLQIATKAKESGLSVQQTQKITADLFKGAGEDAGGFLTIIEQLDAAYKINLNTLDDYGKIQAKTLELETELADEKQRLAQNLEGLSKTYDTLTTQLLTEVIGAFNSVYEAIFRNETIIKKINKSAQDFSQNKSFTEVTIEIQKTEEQLASLQEKIKGVKEIKPSDGLLDGLQDFGAGVGGAIADGIGLDSKENFLELSSQIDATTKKLDILRKRQSELEKTDLDEYLKSVEEAFSSKNETIKTSNRLTDQQIKKQIALKKALNDRLSQLKEDAALLNVGGADSEEGLKYLEEQAQNELDILIEKMKKQKDVVQLSENEISLLRQEITSKTYDKIEAIRKEKQNKELQSDLDAIRDFYKSRENDIKNFAFGNIEANDEDGQAQHSKRLLENKILELEAERDVLIEHGQSILEIEAALIDARIALKNSESEMFEKAEQEKRDSIQLTIDKQNEAFNAIASISQSLGSLFGEQGEKFGQFVQTFASVSQQLNTLAQSQIATSQAVTTAKTSEGVARASALPFPANIPAIATTLSTVIAAFATVSSLGRKKFYWGTENVTGGMGDRDDVPALLRRDERVVPVHINRQLKGIKNADLPKLLQNYHSPVMPVSQTSEISLDQTAINKAIASQTKTNFYLDENGFTKRVLKNGNEIIYRKNRYQ